MTFSGEVPVTSETSIGTPEISVKSKEIVSVIRRKNAGKMSGKMSGKILGLIKADHAITIPELADTIDVTPRTIERYLQKLQSDALLKRIGPAKGGHWEVVE